VWRVGAGARCAGELECLCHRPRSGGLEESPLSHGESRLCEGLVLRVRWGHWPHAGGALCQSQGGAQGKLVCGEIWRGVVAGFVCASESDDASAGVGDGNCAGGGSTGGGVWGGGELTQAGGSPAAV